MSSTKPKTDRSGLHNLLKTILFFPKAYLVAIRSLKSRDLPALVGLFISYSMCVALVWKLDYVLLNKLHVGFLRPEKIWWLRIPYVLAISTSGLFLLGLWRLTQLKILLKRLTEVMLASGLKNSLGKLPGFIFDRPVDEHTRKMRLTRAGLPLESFEKAKTFIESGLQVYVDDIKEDRIAGTVDLVYSNTPMPDFWELDDIKSFNNWSFSIGKTRSQLVKISLSKVPHLLVAGQTGGGKSTFLRQFITTIFVNNPSTSFTLIDLKGGLEFQLFEKLGKRVEVAPDLQRAITKLVGLERLLKRRMGLIKARRFKDIDGLLDADPGLLNETDKDGQNQERISKRHIVVVDEAAELFLTGAGHSSKDTQEARRIMGLIARQGRSVGLHLVIATQRPDTRSLDPQIKANLPGVLCFQMANDASSITVLGNGRAMDLPSVPGRAIWKTGADQFEVQTPHLTTQRVEELLQPFEKEASKIETENSKPSNGTPEVKVHDLAEKDPGVSQ